MNGTSPIPSTKFQTTPTTTRKIRDYDDSGEDDDDESDARDVLNYGVPIAIMLVIVVSLCTIVVYTKFRKRRQRAAGVRRDTAPNISGGVAMSEYLNYIKVN